MSLESTIASFFQTGETVDDPSVPTTKVEILMVRAENLLAKDRSWTTRQRTTSDPYAQIFVHGTLVGTTRTVTKNCSPTWYDCFEYNLPTHVLEEHQKKLDEGKNNNDKDDEEEDIKIHLWDQDVSTKDDFLGVAFLPLRPTKGAEWFDIETGRNPLDILHYCRKAQGRIQVEIKFHQEKAQE